MLYNSFTYNSITFSDFVRDSGYMADMVSGEQVGIRDTITALPGIDGVERYKSLYGDRLIEIRGWILGETESDLYTKKNALIAAFDIRTLEAQSNDGYGFLPLEFTETGQSAARYYCKPIRSTLTIQERRTGLSLPFAVLLEAKDPNKYVTTLSSITLTPADAAGSSSFPFAFPVAFSSGTYSATATFANTGSAIIWPTSIKIYGPCNGPVIENNTAGDKLQFTSDVQLTATDYIVIDPARGTAYKYDVNDQPTNIIQYLTSTSRFWQLGLGNNQITYTASSMTAGSYATVEARLTS